MKLKKLFVAAALALGLGVGAVAGISASKNAVEARANEDITVYYAISEAAVGSYTVKLNVNRGGPGWQQVTMEDVGTYGEWKLYSAAYDDVYGGTDEMQFQLYNGGSQVSQVVAHGKWKTNDVYSGKVWINGQSDWFDRSTAPSTPSSANVYVNAYSWSNLYVYTYETVSGGKFEKLGSYPGTRVEFSDENLQFNGGNKLQKISVPYASSSNVRFIISDGTDNPTNKSADMSLTANAYYHHNGSAWVADTDDLADAAKFVDDFNAARLAVTATDKVKAYSICGLSASYWLGIYNPLSADVKAYINAASVWTYTDKDSTGADARVTFLAMMTELADRNARGVGGALTANVLGNNSGFVVGAGIAVLAALLLGSLFFVAKKKKQF